MVTGLGGIPRIRKTYCFTATSCEADYAVYNSSLTAVVRGIKERVFYVKKPDGFAPPFKPRPEDFRKIVEGVTAFFVDHVKSAQPMSRDQFVNYYRGRRQTMYRNAAVSLTQKPLSVTDFIIRLFIKAEKYNHTLKPDPAARVIQPRGPRATVEVGRYVRPIEKKIYKLINHLFAHTLSNPDIPTVCKGLNAEERGAALAAHWKEFNRPVAVGIDASRFDQHVSPAALEWEHSIYRLYYPKDKYFAWMLRNQIHNRGTARVPDGKVKYQVHGNRMSGDPNTALGNVLIMCSGIWSYIQTLGFKVTFVNDGDDGVLFCERGNLAKLQAGIQTYFQALGFTMTVEPPVFELEDIEFCQCHPVWDGQKYIAVRDPRVAIAKDSVAIKPLTNEKLAKRWAAAVGTGGLALAAGLPVWQEFYHSLNRFADGARPLQDPTLEGSGMVRMAKGMNRSPQPISPSARLSFFKAFKLSPGCQMALEDYYRQYSPIVSDTAYRFPTSALSVGVGREGW